jgi:hypothetical protein
MADAACLWCETSLKPNSRICPECGLLSPAGDPKPASTRRSKAVSRGWHVALALLAVPLMLSVAYAARTSGLSLVAATGVTAAAGPIANPLQPPAVYVDPLQRSVWVDGVKAVQQALVQTRNPRFTESYVNVAAGHVVSFCGEVAGTSGYESANGAQRFISVFGQTQATILESNDASFGVLWTRVCAQDQTSA